MQKGQGNKKCQRPEIHSCKDKVLRMFRVVLLKLRFNALKESHSRSVDDPNYYKPRRGLGEDALGLPKPQRLTRGQPFILQVCVVGR